MKKLLKTIFVISMVISAGKVSAAVISFSDSFGTQGSSTDVSVNGSFLETLEIQGFDSSLGTLTGVSINVSAQLDSTGSSKNVSDADGRAEVGIFMILPFKVSSDFTNDFTLIAADAVNPYVDEKSAPPSTYNLIPNTANDTFIYSLTTGQINGSLSENNLSDFITDNVIEFDFEAFVNTDIDNQVNSGTGTFINTFTTAAWGMIDVTYTYETSMVTVPAPNTLGIFGLILVGLVVTRSRVK